MLARVRSAVVAGPIALPVTLEIESSRTSLPRLALIGSVHTSVLESRERVLSALRSVGIHLPHARVIVNVQPVDIPKSGSSLDVALALGLLSVHSFIPHQEYCGYGELGLDGSIRSCFGDLALADALAHQQDRAQGILVPGSSAPLLNQHPQSDRFHLFHNLGELITFARQQSCALSAVHPLFSVKEGTADEASLVPAFPWNISETFLKVLTLIAAGGHHALLYGSPGIGKSHSRTFLEALLPQPSREELLERAIRQSVMPLCATLHSTQRTVAPHHSITFAGFLGGGSPLRPGAITLAHNGILFLDELLEFQRPLLDALRQPLEDESIHIFRLRQAERLPCSFTLVATANPCACGWQGTSKCRCLPEAIDRYRQRLSGPLLDRLDIQYRVVEDTHSSCGQSVVRAAQAAVIRAHAAQRQRHQESACPERNRSYSLAHLESLPGTTIAKSFWRSFSSELSWRRRLKLWRLARTLADLEGKLYPEKDDFIEAYHLISHSDWGA